jgi:lysophospholipase L1-like esterase
MEIEFPNSKILFFGPLPTGLDANSKQREKYNAIHNTIANLDEKPRVNYYNLISSFTNEEGHLKDVFYSNDGVHLKPEGYKVWGKFIGEKYNKLIN